MRDYSILNIASRPEIFTIGTVMKSNFKLSGQRGFSLVELLVVIAVIAIIAAIAIPNIANITAQAKIAKDQRNAQNIASVAAAARAAGNTTASLGTATDAITSLVAGVTATLNNNNVVSFSITPLGPEEITGATAFLVDGSGTTPLVTYNPDPGSTTTTTGGPTGGPDGG